MNLTAVVSPETEKKKEKDKKTRSGKEKLKLKKNSRAQSLPPSAVVSEVALSTFPGARRSTQLRKTYIETSKTYFCSSSCVFLFVWKRERWRKEERRRWLSFLGVSLGVAKRCSLDSLFSTYG